MTVMGYTDFQDPNYLQGLPGQQVAYNWQQNAPGNLSIVSVGIGQQLVITQLAVTVSGVSLLAGPECQMTCGILIAHGFTGVGGGLVLWQSTVWIGGNNQAQAVTFTLPRPVQVAGQPAAVNTISVSVTIAGGGQAVTSGTLVGVLIG